MLATGFETQVSNVLANIRPEKHDYFMSPSLFNGRNIPTFKFMGVKSAQLSVQQKIVPSFLVQVPSRA